MRPHKARGQEEGFVVLRKFLQKLKGGRCRFPVGQVRSVPVILHRDKHSVGHRSGLATLELRGEDVQVEAGVVTRRVRFLTR